MSSLQLPLWIIEDYGGDNCETELTCEALNCQNGGSCIQYDFYASCLCPRAYRGLSCEIETVCSNNPCFNGGKIKSFNAT